jgi:hypothetical protein
LAGTEDFEARTGEAVDECLAREVGVTGDDDLHALPERFPGAELARVAPRAGRLDDLRREDSWSGVPVAVDEGQRHGELCGQAHAVGEHARQDVSVVVGVVSAPLGNAS